MKRTSEHPAGIAKKDVDRIAYAVARRRKEAVLYLRINRQDLDNLKKKARRYKVPYQSFISEILHHYAA